MHNKPFGKAGQTVTLSSGPYAGEEYRIEDYWDRVSGQSWSMSAGNPAALQYAIKAPSLDDEVLYGKIGGLGYLVHVSWL